MEDTPRTKGQKQAAIADEAVALLRKYTDRGPLSARALICDESTIILTLRGCLTSAELMLARTGHAVEVMAVRHALQITMRSELIALVERLCGVRVVALLADTQHDPDVTMEVFLIEQ